MTWYIAVDVGPAWDDITATGPLEAWGVSSGQKERAEKLQPGDRLLHFINHVQAWAGYSDVTGALTPNTRNSDGDWRSALPWMIPIANGVYLSKSQCQRTRALEGVGDRHRQASFTVVPDSEAAIIVAAIDTAFATSDVSADAGFNAKWDEGADSYYGGIRKAGAYYKCEACGADGLSWSKSHLDGHLREGDADSSPDWFLEAAHIVARSEGGAVTPDNIRALCKNCHHVIDRLPPEEKRTFMRMLPSVAHRRACETISE